MSKSLLIFVVAVLFIVVGLSGCNEIDSGGEQSITLSDGTKVTGDINMVQILNYSLVTEAIDGRKIGDGFIHSEETYQYMIRGTAKNTAGEMIGFGIKAHFYDKNDIYLHTEQSPSYQYVADTYIRDFYIDYNMWQSSSEYFENVDYFEFEISGSVMK